MHYILFYDVRSDYVEKRALFRELQVARTQMEHRDRRWRQASLVRALSQRL